MTARVLAVYQDGVLRPAQPLPLVEGETVTITWSRPETYTAAAEEAVQQIRAAKTLEEWIAAANTAPDEDDGYDLLQALEENRKVSGDQRLLFGTSLEGGSR